MSCHFTPIAALPADKSGEHHLPCRSDAGIDANAFPSMPLKRYLFPFGGLPMLFPCGVEGIRANRNGLSRLTACGPFSGRDLSIP